jgi:imidazolonepropionase-like amidohydrolase
MLEMPVVTCRWRPVVVAIVWFASCLSLAAQGALLAITNANVVDVVAGRILANHTVVVRGRTIEAVAPNTRPPDGARIVDAGGGFLIPGLWDMHAHLQTAGRNALQLYVANGVTGVRDMGADLDFMLAMREDVAAGRSLGPEIIAAGPILDDAPGDWPLRIRVRNADEGRAAVQMLKRRGVDLIKVHNFTPREAFFAIADESRRQSLPFAGHVPLKVTIEEGVAAGMASIEHFSEDGRVWKACSGGGEYRPEPCRAYFDTLARRGVWQTPTLVTLFELAVAGTPRSSIAPEHMQYAGSELRSLWADLQRMFVKRPELIDILKRLSDTGRVAARDMASAGVGILAGCDALIPGFCVHDELAAMVQSGMTPLAALRSATVNPARYLGREGTAGTVDAGKAANLVLLEANPLADIANVRRMQAVVINGRLLDRTALDRLLRQARAATER